MLQPKLLAAIAASSLLQALPFPPLGCVSSGLNQGLHQVLRFHVVAHLYTGCPCLGQNRLLLMMGLLSQGHMFIHICKRDVIAQAKTGYTDQSRPVSSKNCTRFQQILQLRHWRRANLKLRKRKYSGVFVVRQEGEAEAAAPQEAFEGGKVTLLPTTTDLTLSERQVLEINLRVQRQNGAPPDFPVFVRQGFDIKVLADGYTEDSQGLIYKELESGSGDRPVDGQEVTFNYVAYNESGAIIDSSYRKGRPAQTRLGIRGLIPGFELGVKDMNVGGKRRLVVPPELGPPVGPSTFFSAKQCEVFDVELLAVKSCSRRQVAMFSSVVCE
eukprot:jgi/Botrbrau1/6973/Bobra.0165s0010.1